MTSLKTPNPQGKGQVALLNHWQNFQHPAKAKNPDHWLKDYLLSMLVLSARFSFKPVVGQPYFLYWYQQSLRLRMIEPAPGNTASLGIGFATCELQPDLTWQVSLLPVHEGQPKDEVWAMLRDFHHHFEQRLCSDLPVIEELPFYDDSLAFYPRLMATGLSASLQESLRLSGDKSISAKGLVAQCDRGLPLFTTA